MSPSDTSSPSAASRLGGAPAVAPWVPDAALLVGRILLVAIFPIAGYLKATGWAGTVAFMERSGLPVPAVTAVVVTAIELVLPVLVILGLWTRWALLALLLFTAATAYIGHPFWRTEGAAWFGQLMNFWKNMAMVGGMAAIAAVGPGRYALRP